MKRWMLFLLAVLMLAVVGPACGPTPTPAVVVVETSMPEPTAVVVQPTQGTTQETIVFMTWASSDFEQQAIEKMVQQFEAQNPPITVELVIVR